jgi:hypothetical protein
MGKRGVVGRCRLCRKMRPLCRSHYFGAALHKLCQQGGEPVVMTPKLISLSQRQLWAHLLCLSCEERLNKFGETPVLRLVDDGISFPLLARMDLVPRFFVKSDGQNVLTYSGSQMGINTDALTHFALGILWKGGVHRWPTIRRQTTSIDLRGYKDEIRNYLLGLTALPRSVAVIVAASEDQASRGVVFPPGRFRGQPYTHFSMVTRGIWFDIVLGEEAAERHKHLCCVRSDRNVIQRANCEQRLLHAGRRLHSKAEIAANLKK